MCFTVLCSIVGGIFVMVTLLRWFEQITQAVDDGQWGKVLLLVICPFAAWGFLSSVSTGRPAPVPHHEPVRGFGSVPKPPGAQPPPGTPAHFIGMPVIPVKPATGGPARPGLDADKMEKLRKKMREQGMLDEQKDADK